MPTPEHPSTTDSQSKGETTIYSQAGLAKELESLGINYASILGLSLPTPTDPDADIKAAVATVNAERDAAKLEGLKKIEQFNHNEQYQAQVDILRQAGVIETLPSGAEGIIGIDGREYPTPTLEQVESLLATNSELVKTKLEQGFTKLLLVPFGMQLDKLIKAYGQALKDQADSPSGLTSSDGTTHELDTTEPVAGRGYWQGRDKSGQLVYYPERFDGHDHGGQTKSELIAGGQAWQIMLVEDMTDIPVAGASAELADRGQLEAGSSPRDYLAILESNPAYAGESGLTPEAWLTLAMTRLDESGQVIDDFDGDGKVDYLLGACETPSGLLLFGSWNRAGGKAGLGNAYPGGALDDFGVRSAVRIF